MMGVDEMVDPSDVQFSVDAALQPMPSLERILDRRTAAVDGKGLTYAGTLGCRWLE